MNLQAIQEAFRLAVATASGLPEARVQWKETAMAGTWRAYPAVDLVLRGVDTLGEDSFERTDTSAEDEPLEITQMGPRQIRVDVRVETSDQSPGETSMAVATAIRTRLQRPSIRAELHRTAEVALALMAPTVDADFPSDSRVHSLTVFGVVLNAAENDVDTLDAGDYFHTVEVASDTLDHPDGSSGPQVDLVVTSE